MTSLDGAAVRDIIKVLRRRYPNAHIVIRPTRVQGEGAALDIARAMAAIGKVPGVDVVIVGRGGGSIEDLWAFNEEVVARAIAGCPVPTISAVGHETDVTIADFVADLRAPTPSAAAEMVVARKDDFCARIDRLAQRVCQATRLHRRESRLRRRGATGLPACGRCDARRHVADLRTTRRTGSAGAARSELSVAARTLETFDLRRRLGRIRTRLVAADGAARRRDARTAVIAPTAGFAAPPRGSRRSARSPSSAGAMPCAGTPTARRSSATPRASPRATACASRWRAANWMPRQI